MFNLYYCIGPLYRRHRSEIDVALTGSQSKELMFISSSSDRAMLRTFASSVNSNEPLFDWSVKSISVNVDGCVRLRERVRASRQLA